jgi:two-component system, LytTR family, response regulator LytT
MEIIHKKLNQSKMRIIIIEDELKIAHYLQDLLLEIEPQISVLAKLATVAESVSWLKAHTCDLIFMDINLGKELAFKIFEQVEVKTPVIFTTAYDQYALQAFKVNSLDYLLKPIDKQALNQSLQKYKLWQEPASLNLNNLLAAFQKPTQEYQKRFMATSGEKIVSVKTEEIAYFAGHQRYVFLVNFKNEQYLVDFTLEKLEELLNPYQFFRINRQFIVNFEAIKNMYAYLRGRIKLELNPPSKEDTVVSIERATAFKQWLNR